MPTIVNHPGFRSLSLWLLGICCVCTLFGCLMILGGGSGGKCGESNCTVGVVVALAPWAVLIIYAIAYAFCIMEAKNEKASSDLNMHFQNHGTTKFHFQLKSSTHQTYGYNNNGPSFETRHLLLVTVAS